MKRILTRTGRILLTVMAMVWLSAASVWAEETPEQFVKGTDINDISVGSLTVEEATAKIRKTYTDTYQLTITEKGGKKEMFGGADFGYSAAVPDGLKAILDEQNATGRRWGPSVDNAHTMDIPAVYDEAALKGKIAGLSCISSGDIVRTTDARVTAYTEGQPFTIIPEVQGNDVDAAKVEAVIRAAVAAGRRDVNLESEGCYYTPQIHAFDERLQQLCQIMNQCRDMVITYTFGGAEGAEGAAEALSGETITTWLTGTENGEIGVNRDAAAAYVKSLADRYNTAGSARVFHTFSGRDVKLTGPYGWVIDQAGETDRLIAAIRTGQSQAREPLYARKAASRTSSDWGSTYVEIDLTAQHVYMYQNGSVVWDSACVTGNVSKDYTTPGGIYSLAYKQTDRILRGEKKEDGTYEYESHVDFWMPFNGGIGLHDASWRGKFGGTIYQTGGSHGCVNLPPAKAKELYELVYTGIPVICYD